ncbi:MAG: IucA/IucC family protein, partial [Pseudonocardiaceae bacterium]
MSLSVPAELTTSAWRCAGRDLMAKMLAELSYEELLDPVPAGAGSYRIDVGGGVSYTFRARRGAFDCWRVDPSSVQRRPSDGRPDNEVDPLQFLLDAHQALGLSGDTTGHLARELCATLAADTRLLAEPRTAAELAELPYAELEGHQSGHPWLIPNKGRMGLSASDTARYVPEARQALRLPWMAVHRSLARYRSVEGLDEDRLLSEELDGPSRQRFESALRERGADPGEYHWLPVHPWQWDEIVVPVFAAEVAAGRIVPLGDGPDRYLAQQSIRTFSNIDTPQRRHVKLPLSILNTLVWRGLPTERTLAAPAVTRWILGLAAQDAFLRDETRVVLLGE